MVFIKKVFGRSSCISDIAKLQKGRNSKASSLTLRIVGPPEFAHPGELHGLLLLGLRHGSGGYFRKARVLSSKRLLLEPQGVNQDHRKLKYGLSGAHLDLVLHGGAGGSMPKGSRCHYSGTGPKRHDGDSL